MIRVLLVDDEPAVCHGLTLLLGEYDDVRIVGAARDGVDAVQLAGECTPDVVLMDLSMPRMDGVEATRHITTASPEVAVVVLTTFADRRRVLASLDAGAVGYLMKDTRPEALHEAIVVAACGGSPIDPVVARTIVDARRASSMDTLDAAGLTDKQTEVLRLLAEGLPNRLIARRLVISEKTVKAHLTQIYHTLGVADRVQAALWAQRQLG